MLLAFRELGAASSVSGRGENNPKSVNSTRSPGKRTGAATEAWEK